MATELIKKPNLSILPAHQALAVEMKYEGHTYQQIANEIRYKYEVIVPENTIKWWFYKLGPLRQYYEEYAATMNEMKVVTIQNTFKAKLENAQAALMLAMSGKGNSAQVTAAREWLDRALGKVPDKLHASVGVYTFADWIKQETIKENEQHESKDEKGAIPETTD